VKRQFIRLVARDFNPSIIRPNWLKRHLGLKDVKRGVYLEKVSYCEAGGLELLATPEFLELKAKGRRAIDLWEYAEKIVKTLPHTPYESIVVGQQRFIRRKRLLPRWRERLADASNALLGFKGDDHALMLRFTQQNAEIVVSVATAGDRFVVEVMVKCPVGRGRRVEQVLSIAKTVYEETLDRLKGSKL